MAPSQPSSDTEPNIVNRSSFPKSSGKNLRYLSNSEDGIVKVEDQWDDQTKAREDADDIVRVAEAEDPNETDYYSSSFDGTVSGTENSCGLSDTEVKSCFYGDNAFGYDGFGSVFPIRKKKFTAHWRSFIRPLMWRCKWTELRMKEFQLQASKYARELAGYDQIKQLEFYQFTLENFGSKSLPLTFQGRGKKAMKRRKRKRVEDTTDVTSYMAQHSLFSYHENKMFDTDGSSVAEEFPNPVLAEENTADLGEFGIRNDCSLYGFKDGNDSLEEIVRKIETIHSHVHKLKSRLVMVIAETSPKFSSSENLSILVPFDGQTSSARSPTFSACNRETASLGALYASNQHVSDYDIGDFIMPESMLSSYGEAISVPDIIESTVSLLSSADVTMHESQIGDSCEAIMDNVLVLCEAADIEKDTSNTIQNQTTEMHQVPEESGQEESSNPSPIAALEADLTPITSTLHEQSRLTTSLASELHFPKSKRKRGERKAGSGGWNR